MHKMSVWTLCACLVNHIWSRWHIFWINNLCLHKIAFYSDLGFQVLWRTCTVSNNASHRRPARVHHCRPHSHHRCHISTGHGCSGHSYKWTVPTDSVCHCQGYSVCCRPDTSGPQRDTDTLLPEDLKEIVLFLISQSISFMLIKRVIWRC